MSVSAASVNTSRGHAGGAHAALVEQHHLVGDRGRLVEVVQHDADRDAVLVGQVADQVEDLHLVAQVEERGRLVEQQHAGVLGQAGGQPDPLQLAAGQLVDGAVGHRGHAGDLHRPGDGPRPVGVVGAPAAPVGVAAVADHVAHADAGRHRTALGEQRDPAGEVARGQRQRGRHAVVEQHVAADRPVQPGQRAQQRRLAAAVRPHERRDLTRTQRDRRAVHDGIAVVGEVEPDAAQAGAKFPLRHEVRLAYLSEGQPKLWPWTLTVTTRRGSGRPGRRPRVTSGGALARNGRHGGSSPRRWCSSRSS